jgi:hypothetical protein
MEKSEHLLHLLVPFMDMRSLCFGDINMLCSYFVLACIWLDIVGAQSAPQNTSHAINVTSKASPIEPTWEESEKCFDALDEYARLHRSFHHPETQLGPPVIKTYFTTFETVKSVGSGEHYTACDGIPRFRFTPGGITSVVTSQMTATAVGTYFPSNSSTHEFPKCRMNHEFCQEKYDTFLANSSNMESPDLGSLNVGSLQRPCSSLRQCYLGFDAEIVILYWPPLITSRDICASDGVGAGVTIPVTPSQTIITTSAITFRGQDLYLREQSEEGSPSRTFHWKDNKIDYTTSSVLTGPFTLTWPTAYLAHHPIFVDVLKNGPVENDENWENHIPRSPAGIMPLHTTDLASLQVTILNRNLPTGVDFARAVASGEWAEEKIPSLSVFTDVVPFDFGHLQDPVPAHIYFNGRTDCWNKQTHCGTITDDTYRPTLLLRNKAWIDNGLGDCAKMYLNDPPIALSPIEGNLKTLELPKALPRINSKIPALAKTSPGLKTEAGITSMIPTPTNASPGSKTEASRWPKETKKSKEANILPTNPKNPQSAVAFRGSASRVFKSFGTWLLLWVTLLSFGNGFIL